MAAMGLSGNRVGRVTIGAVCTTAVCVTLGFCEVAGNRAGKSMKLVYYAVGKADFLYPSIAPTRAMFARHGIRDVYNESEGGHTWINWRRYFNDFAPRLFR